VRWPCPGTAKVICIVVLTTRDTGSDITSARVTSMPGAMRSSSGRMRIQAA